MLLLTKPWGDPTVVVVVVAGVSVILRAREPPHDFATLRARDDAAVILVNAGVTTAIAVGDLDNARNLRWEAGTRF